MCSVLRLSMNALRQTIRNESKHVHKLNENMIFSSTWTQNVLQNQKRLFSSEEDTGKEIRIPTPYGHIAGKEYGDPKGHPVLAVHGWMDNCGTFELLLPHIVKENNLHVVAMDEPGCGYSSHLPPGAEYPKWSLIKEMKRVTDYLEWKNFSIIGHSRGGGFSIFFAAMFPEMVQSVVSLDVFGAFFSKENYPYTDREALVLNKILSFDHKLMKNPNLDETAPVYTEAEAIQRIMTATPFGLTETTAKILMKRGSKPYKGGIIFTRDLRHKLPIMGPIPTKAEFLEFTSKIRCDLLVIMATKGPFSGFDYSDWFNIYKSKCRTFQHAKVKGKHYVHMDSPDEVASHINSFMQQSILKGPITNLEFQ